MNKSLASIFSAICLLFCNNIFAMEYYQRLEQDNEIQEYTENLIKLIKKPNDELIISIQCEKLIIHMKKHDIGFDYIANNGYTLLYIAVQYKLKNLLKTLLKNGANINLISPGNGRTPLMAAAANNSKDLCKFLLKNGADRSIKSRDGKTAYEIALGSKNKRALNALTEKLGK